MSKYGTLSVLEDLAADNDVVAGREEEIARRFQQALDVHNAAFSDMVSDICMLTSAAQLPYGGASPAIIDELDEWGSADASKPAAHGNLGLPLRIYGGTVQWTRTYFETVTASELAAQLDAFALADIQTFQRNIKRALFTNTNTASYFDRLQTKLTYDLKALLNADSADIPAAPNGTTFDGSTHTHYIGDTSLAQADVISLIDTVVEHGVSGEMRVYISKGSEAAVRNFADFSPYIDARVTVTGASSIGNQSLDVSNPDNRAIGVLGGAEVWVKPWVPANYFVAVDVNGSEKPLAIRTRTGSLTGTGAFRILSDHEHFPLRAQNIGREYGVGVVGRAKAAVMFVDAGGSYVAPTL